VVEEETGEEKEGKAAEVEAAVGRSSAAASRPAS
jgi:hypothetical protein